MQTCHTCQLKNKCPAVHKLFGEFTIHPCDYYVPPDGTVLDEKWLVKQVQTAYGKQTQT